MFFFLFISFLPERTAHAFNPEPLPNPFCCKQKIKTERKNENKKEEIFCCCVSFKIFNFRIKKTSLSFAPSFSLSFPPSLSLLSILTSPRGA